MVVTRLPSLAPYIVQFRDYGLETAPVVGVVVDEEISNPSPDQWGKHAFFVASKPKYGSVLVQTTFLLRTVRLLQFVQTQNIHLFTQTIHVLRALRARLVLCQGASASTNIPQGFGEILSSIVLKYISYHMIISCLSCSKTLFTCTMPFPVDRAH